MALAPDAGTPLQDQIAQILGDPGAMAQIQQMASQLFTPGTQASNTQGPEDASPEPDVSLLMQTLTHALRSDKVALVDALGPYLTDSRRVRLQRAIQLAHLATLARQALQQLGGGTEHV